MVSRVIKRDGTEVDFNADKVRKALQKASDEVEGRFRIRNLEHLVCNIIGELDKFNRAVGVEEVQEIVET